MYMEGFTKLSRAQEIRQAAFHMALQSISRQGGYNSNGPDLETIKTEASLIEDWIWEADENRKVEALTQEIEAAIYNLRHRESVSREEIADSLERALNSYKSEKPVKSKRR